MTRDRGLLLVIALAVAASLTACGSPAPLVPDTDDGGGVAAETVDESTVTREPRGRVRVAYPDVPADWVAPEGDDPAAIDLGALWGLPLFHTDAHGHLRDGLVREVSQRAGEDGFVVELTLAEGSWSDGTPVTAADLAATVAALRDTPHAPALEPLVGVEVTDERRAVLRFDRSYARWPWLLAETGGVLPAHVLHERGLDAYDEDVPVSGGRFRLVRYEPGRRAVFGAHSDGPLPAPTVREIEILFAPRYDTALGLLRDGRVDVVAGHLALNPVERAETLEGVSAAAPLGGTWVGLDWRRGAALGGADRAPARRAVAASIDVGELVEGLLGRIGAVATSPIPGVAGPFLEVSSDMEPPTVTVATPGWHEAPGFTARALQRDLEAAGGGLEVVTLGTPDFVEDGRVERDAALRIHRDPPRPSLVPYSDGGTRSAALRADSSVADDPESLSVLAERSYVVPLYRIGVAHAWRGVTGLTPSSWPGLAFSRVGEWEIEDAGTEGDAVGIAAVAAPRLPSRPRGGSPAVHARVAELADAHG